MKSSIPATVLALSLFAAPALAQGPAFDSPGQPSYATVGQTTRFSSEFNPAIGFVIDGFADYVDADSVPDGFDLSLRLLEFNAAAYVDPDAWAYVVISSENLETPEVEEGAVEYLGLPGRSTVKAGRFFVDFGKQMQSHLEELRTPERPLVLREFLGEELAGTGVQFDHWFPVGDDTPVRFSLGVFGSLLSEAHHEEEGGPPEPESLVAEQKKLDELSFTGRVTGMTDAGDRGQMQLGASVRSVPEFSFEDETSGLAASGLSNTVYGLDLTWGTSDETATRSTSAGLEWLLADGDLSAEVDTSGATPVLNVRDDSSSGFLVFADHAWNSRDSAGVQYSMAESVEDGSVDLSELDVYVTRHLTEYRRIRLGVTLADEDGADDSVRVYVQFTNFFGSHSHGLNW